MFPYFGRKAVLTRALPAPTHDLVVEPFAGSMAYTLLHRPFRALGIEKDERVVELWHRMAALEEVPEPPIKGTPTDDLLVKLCSYSEHALTSGTMTVTSRMLRDWGPVHRRAIEAAPYARDRIVYRQGDYSDAPDIVATWLIDPPYQRANRRGYREGASGIDYAALADWVLSRRGQVIVCEQEGADWLPFQPLAALPSHRGAVSAEVVFMQEVA